RIHRHVSGNRPQLRVALHPHRPIPPLENMTRPPVALIELERVTAVEPLHPHPEVRVRRLDHEMHVILHEAVAEQSPATSPDRSSEQAEIDLPIDVVAVDQPLVVTAGIHVKDAAGNFLAGLAWHVTQMVCPAALAPGSDP